MLIDALLKDEFRYEIYLCKPSDYSIISCLTECTLDRTIKRQLRSIDEFEFTLPRYWDDKASSINTNFDLVVAGSIILVESLIDDVVQERMYFRVTEPELISDERECKIIRCYSLQYQWGKIKIKNFKTNDVNGTLTTTQLYVAGTPWDDDDPTVSGILNYILEEKLLNTWTVNSMSVSLIGIYRTFDISESSLLEMVDEIQNNFNCVFFFDTYNRKIDIVDYAELPDETGLILHDEGFIKKLQQKIKIDEIVTRLWIDGDNDEATGAPRTIISENITQQPYLDDFTYFRTATYMSSGLLAALTALDVKKTNAAGTFGTYQSDLTTLQGDLATLEAELLVLQTNLEIYENKEDGAIRAGGTYDNHTYAYWHGLVTTQQGLITSKNSAIGSKNTAITNKQNQIIALAYTIAYENPVNFTTAQLQELLNFINEETAKCSSSDPAELMSFGTSLLARKANPPIEFELDIVDLFDSKELSYTWDKLVLGAKVDLVSDIFSIAESPRVVSYTHNPDKCTLSIVVSNKEYLNSDLDYITAMFSKSKKGADTIKNEREVYKDYVTNDKTIVNDFITSPIDASTNNIIMSKNDFDASVITRRGMYMKGVNDDVGQMRILGNRIVFCADNTWDDYSLAITPQGIRTDQSFRLISKTVYGGNNLVTLDGNGLKIYGSGTTTDSIEIFNKSNVKTFGLDSDGNVKMYSGVITWANVNTDPVATNALAAAQNIANGTYSGGTLISNKTIYSPTILNTKVGLTDNDASGKAVGEVGYSALDTDIRIWAGDSYNNRATAPFKVTQGGAVTASNITITGGSINIATDATIGNNLYIGDNAGISKVIYFRTTSDQESSISMSNNDMHYDCWADTWITSGGSIFISAATDENPLKTLQLSSGQDIDVSAIGDVNINGNSIKLSSDVVFNSDITFLSGSSINFTNCTVSNLVVKFS